MFSRIGLLFLITFVLGASLVACGDNDDNDVADTTMRSADEPASEPAQPSVDADSAADTAMDRSGQSPQISTTDWDRKVIRSGELDLIVEDVSAASRHARDLVADHGGYLSSSSAQTLSDDDEYADLAFEVPADAFEPVMNDLSDSSHVIRVEHESTSSQDVTEEYVDLESRLGNLESTESRFVELLDEAHTISEILDVENEISRIRGEIEQIKGRLNYLEQRTDYSRIYLTLKAEEEDVTVAGHSFAPGETAREAWNASMEFVGTLGNAAITVIVFFWWAWPLAAVAALVFARYRRRAQVEQQAA